MHPTAMIAVQAVFFGGERQLFIKKLFSAGEKEH